MTITLDPPELTLLKREIYQHPELRERLNPKTNPAAPTDLSEWIGEVGVYAEVAFDGWYEIKQLSHICTYLTGVLYKKRTSLIIDSGTPGGG